MTSIFLSHSSRDKFFVRKLAERLKSVGIRVWLDEAEINIGDSLTEKIGHAITEMDFVGVVLSNNSVNSEWVQRELQIAIQRELATKRVVVLPLLLDPVEIPHFLKDKLYADFTTPERFEETFPKLLKALGVRAEEIKPLEEPIAVSEAVPTMTPAEPPLAMFEDIRIIGLDEERSYKPDPQKLLYNIYLKLSSPPPLEWQQIFEAERSFPRHTIWRRAWIEGQYIVIHCVLDELDKYHLRDLRQDVESANNKYREYLMEVARTKASEIRQKHEELTQLKDIKRRLNLD
jgi:hypothetical protein